MNTGASFQTSTLSELIKNHAGGVRIPMIQRDYAQGRASWANPRKRFLEALKAALIFGPSLHLDFVYGMPQEEDGVVAFCPLDGQQRLTTLFLLHWYLAVCDDRFQDFQHLCRMGVADSKFSYQVRPGGRSFFRALVNQPPSVGDLAHKGPSIWMRQQPWFRSVWERDPSVAGAMTMLDAIHEVFAGGPAGIYEKLVTGKRITFEVLDLGAAGLHDDLYSRMNARGRALTTFETFKASYEKDLEKQFPKPIGGVEDAQEFSRKIDNEWLEFMWQRYGTKPVFPEDVKPTDTAFMNLLRAVALVSLPQDKEDDEKDVETLYKGRPDYEDFKSRKWINNRFTIHLIHVLESCISPSTEPGGSLFQSPWFDKGCLLDRVLRPRARPDLSNFLQFAACVRFITRHGLVTERAAAEWMRVVRNLVVNSDVRERSFRQMLAGLDQLLEGSVDIRRFLDTNADKISGFDKQQVAEERLKASLMLADERWTALIRQAEDHGYFRGQIGFLLNFCGIKEDTISGWMAQEHRKAQEDFTHYWESANEMFSGKGLNALPAFLWERSLLAVGDYLLPHGGSRRSFLDDDRSSPMSWKRLLRDDQEGRRCLKTLWDRLRQNENLEQICADVGDAPPWRQVLCATPEALNHCRKRLMRFEERQPASPTVFLLSSKSRGAWYAELFTFHLWKQDNLIERDSRFSPLMFERLRADTGADDDPYLQFTFEHNGSTHIFRLHCHHGEDEGFSLWVSPKDPDEAFRSMIHLAGFVPWGSRWLVRRQTPADPLQGVAFLASVAHDMRLAMRPPAPVIPAGGTV